MKLLTPTNILRASVVFAIGASITSTNRILDTHKEVSNLILETDKVRRLTVRTANSVEERRNF